MAPTFRPYLHSGHIVAFSARRPRKVESLCQILARSSNLPAIAARLYSITYALHTETLHTLPLRLRLQLTDCPSARSRPVSITRLNRRWLPSLQDTFLLHSLHTPFYTTLHTSQTVALTSAQGSGWCPPLRPSFPGLPFILPHHSNPLIHPVPRLGRAGWVETDPASFCLIYFIHTSGSLSASPLLLLGKLCPSQSYHFVGCLHSQLPVLTLPCTASLSLPGATCLDPRSIKDRRLSRRCPG